MVKMLQKKRKLYKKDKISSMNLSQILPLCKSSGTRAAQTASLLAGQIRPLSVAAAFVTGQKGCRRQKPLFLSAASPISSRYMYAQSYAKKPRQRIPHRFQVKSYLQRICSFCVLSG